MTVRERVLAIRLAEKIRKNEAYAEKIGLELSSKKHTELKEEESLYE